MFKTRGSRQKWLYFSRIGEQIPGTPFVAFKVPIHNNADKLNEDDRFTFQDVFRFYPQIGLVIDLTNTTKYYNPAVLSQFDAMYHKISIEGHGTLPSNQAIADFNRVVDQFLRTSRNKLIGVHCTHGVNRTGYLICQYMISKLNLPAMSAINAFQNARGHAIERQIYVDTLYRSEYASYHRNNYNNIRGNNYINNQNNSYNQNFTSDSDFDQRSRTVSDSRSHNSYQSSNRSRSNP